MNRHYPDSHWLPVLYAGLAAWEEERQILTALVKLMNGYTHEMLPADEYYRLRCLILDQWEAYRGRTAEELGLGGGGPDG